MGDGSDRAEQAMAALRGDDPVEAAKALQAALEEDPERLDFLHALAVTQLRLGEPATALALCDQGERVAREVQNEAATVLLPQLYLVRAAACEDLFDPAGALAAFNEILRHEDQNPRARQGIAHLLLAWARTEEGLEALDAYLDDGVDEEEFLEAMDGFATQLRTLLREEIHPVELLNAHRGSYVEFFDHHANRLEAEGWIAEAARMHRDDDGKVVLSVPDGAPEWAGVRVDLVNPETGQPGRVGDQPMVVALADYEALAQAPVLIRWPENDLPFPAWISTQTPWNHLRVQVAFQHAAGQPLSAFTDIVGDWYRAGFDGAFGTADRGRFHEVDELVALSDRAMVVHIDAGRAEVSAVKDLFKRLTVLHGQHPIAAVVVGRGFLPA